MPLKIILFAPAQNLLKRFSINLSKFSAKYKLQNSLTLTIHILIISALLLCLEQIFCLPPLETDWILQYIAGPQVIEKAVHPRSSLMCIQRLRGFPCFEVKKVTYPFLFKNLPVK